MRLADKVQGKIIEWNILVAKGLAVGEGGKWWAQGKISSHVR